MELINHKQKIEDLDWVTADNTETLSALSNKNQPVNSIFLRVTLENWLNLKGDILKLKPNAICLVLKTDDETESFKQDLVCFTHIAIRFSEFKDGRGFSLARIIKEDLKYNKELRAEGVILHDQLFYLARCGFNTFMLENNQDANSALTAFKVFSGTYQAAIDNPLPHYAQNNLR